MATRTDAQARAVRTRITVRLLGDFCVEVDGADQSSPLWRRERVRSLMATLAMRSRVSRSTLAAELWPNHDSGPASNNLRVTLSYLRKAFSDRMACVPVQSDRHSVWLSPEVDWTIDVYEFEHRLEALGMPSATGRWLDAISWYRGEFLSGLSIPADLEIERERLQSMFVTTAVRLGSDLLESGRAGAALEIAERALRCDPWSEAAWILVVRSEIDLGDRTAAARAAKRCLLGDAELGLAPSGELQILLDLLGG